ncbi:MAG TPA: TonB-dependent receptor [Anaeromyxobacter sp.]|nr:TonB-dependent receptor [Anaeromyxobacter sp.]
MAMMLRRLVRIAPLALLVAGTAAAQGTSSITGVVTDASTNKPVVGAVVVVTSPALPAEQTVVTEAGGKFTVPALPAGDYTLAVQMDGYKPFERSDLKLKEATTLRANAQVVPEAVQMEEVVVTGSRIRRKDLTTPAPVTVINHEQIAESGKATIGEFLQALPEQAGGANAQVNNGGDGSQTVDIRGIQANRTLVLINGRRMIASATAQSFYETVDLNGIPTAAVERIEILKDGGSSIYGSDAIGGVVNIITKKKMDGVELSLNYGKSTYGDGALRGVDFVGGQSFERGNFLVAGGYSEQDPVLASQRQHMGTIWSKNFVTGVVSPRGSIGTPNGQFYLYDNCTQGSSAACDHLWDVVNTNIGNGNLPAGTTPVDVNWTAARGVDLFQDPGDRYNYQALNYLYTPLRRWQLWTSGELKLGEAATAFFEGSFVNRFSRQQLAPEPLYTGYYGSGNITAISPDSIYNPYGVQVDAGRRLVEFGDRVFTQEDNTWRLVGGLRGEIGDWGSFLKGWEWNTSIVYASNNNTFDNKGSLRADKINAAIGPSMLDPVTNQPICVSTPGNAASVIPGCVPLNVLGGAGTITPAMIGGLAFDGTDRSQWNMSSFEVNVDGELFKLLAEQPASLAAGYEFRREWGYALPNPISGADESTGNNYLASTPGGYEVNSFYAELSLPLISNVPAVELLELTGSLRASHYSNFGGNTTYKVGARYSPIRDVTLRGTISTAFRAPSVLELYSGHADNFEQATDPCANIDPNAANAATLTANCGAAANNGFGNDQIHSTSGGNSSLKPEEAKIWTAGLVYEPRQLEGLSFTLDYYLINIDKTIGVLGTPTILDLCYNQGQAAYCSLVTRAPNGFPTNVMDTNLNVGKLETSGIDLAARYDLKSTPIGRFSFGAAANWLHNYTVTDVLGNKTYYKGNADGVGPGVSQGGPTWKGIASVVWGLGGFGAGLDGRFIGSYKECGTGSGASGGLCNDPDHVGERDINPYLQWNGFVSYDLKWSAGKTSLMLGVQNIGNSKPPIIFGETYTNSNASLYDYMGRFYYVRLAHAI